eukprot:symbB.v1.2.001906.t2/scaffold102.1/size330044/3
MAELNTLLRVEDFVEEVQTETEQDTSFPSTRSRAAKAFALVLLAVAAVVCLVPSPLATSALADLQEKWEWPAAGQCLCLFDVDRTLTSSPRMRVIFLSWLLLLNAVAACHLSFTEGTNLPEETGHAFLARCAESLYKATEAASASRILFWGRAKNQCLAPHG